MVERRTGMTANTPNNLLIDAPTILVSGTSIGAARDGATWTLEQTIREPNIDGARGPVVGTRRVTRSVARVTFSPLEWTPENWRQFIAGALGNPLRRSTYIIDPSFHIPEVSIIGTRQDGGEAIITLFDALGDSEEISAAMEDENEAAPEVQLTAHFKPTNVSDEEPWSIKLP